MLRSLHFGSLISLLQLEELSKIEQMQSYLFQVGSFKLQRNIKFLIVLLYCKLWTQQSITGKPKQHLIVYPLTTSLSNVPCWNLWGSSNGALLTNSSWLHSLNWYQYCIVTSAKCIALPPPSLLLLPMNDSTVPNVNSVHIFKRNSGGLKERTSS